MSLLVFLNLIERHRPVKSDCWLEREVQQDETLEQGFQEYVESKSGRGKKSFSENTAEFKICVGK